MGEEKLIDEADATALDNARRLIRPMTAFGLFNR
jgi:hypothetical protein